MDSLRHFLSIYKLVLILALVLQTAIPTIDAQVTISSPTSSTPCYGEVVTLVCHHPELATNPGRYFSTIPVWRENGEGITPADDTIYSIEIVANKSLTFLRINITVDHFRNKSFDYSCLLALEGPNGLPTGEVETSGNVTIDPIDQPPPVVTTNTTDTSITLTWNTAWLCFESGTFVVIWNEIGSGTSNNVTISSSPYTISGLQPGTSYEISVHGVSGSGVVSERRVLTVTTTGLDTTSMSPTSNDPTADPTTQSTTIVVAVIIPVVVVNTILIAVISVVISCSVLCFRKRCATYHTDEPQLHSQVSQELEESPPGSREPTPSDPFRTDYAELTFEGVQPIKPPPLDCGVTYTEPLALGERIVAKEDPAPELPPKRQDPKLGKEFRADVANVLTKMGVPTLVCREIKNAPFLTGDYNGIHFVAYCVHTSSDVTAEDVRRTVGAKQETRATMGLLISNQDTIPSDCLLDLDKGGCEFVPVSCYGDEGWGNRMGDKFQGFFPIVAASDDGGEELATPVQEITPGNKPYLVLRSPSPFDYQSLTEPVEDEVHVIDSREETPLLERSFDDALNRDEATPDDQSTLHISASSSTSHITPMQSSGDHLPTQPPADPFRSVPDAENDVDESASLSQSSSDNGFTFTYDLTVNDGHEKENLVLAQESNQLATPVETSDPAHDSLDPLPSPANTVCVSEEVIHNEFVEDEEKALGETHENMPHTGRLVCTPGSGRGLCDNQFNTECLPTPVQDTTTPPLCGGYLRFAALTFHNLMHTEHPRVSGEKRSSDVENYFLDSKPPPTEHPCVSGEKSSSDAENYFLHSKPPPTKKPPVSGQKKKTWEAESYCVFSTMPPLAELNEVVRTGPQFYEDTSVSTSSVSHSESPDDNQLYLLECPVEDGHVTHGRHMDGFQANPSPVTKRSDYTGSVLQDTLFNRRFWSAPNVKLDEINNDGTIVPDTQCTEEKTVTPLEETPLQPTDTLCVGFDWMYSLPVTELLKTMYKLVILGVIAAAVLAQEATAQLSLSATGGVQWYGEQVTLLCTHPVLPHKPEYVQAEPNWKRDGHNIVSFDDFGHRKPLNSTTTKLEFTITENTTGNYTCFLVNAVQGGVDKSNAVTVRPSMLPPPSVTAIRGITNISLCLELPMACSYDLSIVVSWSTAVTGGQGDGTISTTNTSILISPLQPGTQYTVWVQSVAQAEGMTLFSERSEHVWTTLHNTGNSSNFSTSVVPSPTPSDTDQPDFDTPTDGGPAGGDTAAITVPIVVVGVGVGVVAILVVVMGIFLWNKKKRSAENDVLCADDDSGYPCSLDLHNSKDLLQSVACKADETALPLPVQETIPEDGCFSFITSLSSPEEEFLTDQHMSSQPEQPSVGHLPPSMTASEKDKDFPPPKPESTTSMDKPTAKLLSEPVVFTSAPPAVTGMETMYNLLVLGVITATLGQATAQLSLSNTGGVQCYGKQVTLQCTHPVLPQEPEFLQPEVSWRRNGRGVSVVRLGRTNLNRRITQLVFPITDRTVGNYTCFLVNASGGPTVNSSRQIVRPLVPYPLNLTATSDTNRTILNWTLSRNPCGYNVSFNVSWKSTSGAGSGTTSEMSYTITSLQANPKYNVTVQVLMNIKGKTVFGGKMETMVSTNATNGTPSDNCTRVVPTPTHTTTNPCSNVNVNPSRGSGGNMVAITVPVGLGGGVLICLAVFVFVAVGICWRKKNNKQPCPCRVTEQQPLLKECQLSDHYKAVNFEDGCPPPLECTMTGPLGKGEKIVNHSEDVFRTNLLNESLWDDDDSGYLCSLDPHNSKDSKSMLLQSVVCMTDEVDEAETLVFPIQETTPVDGCCSLITGSSAPEEESLTDQHVPSQPEQPLFHHLPSSVTANEQDEEFTPEQESTPSKDETTKFLSDTVFLTSASPMITRPIRFLLDDIYAGDTGNVSTDTVKLLASEGEIPPDGMELLSTSNKVSAFRSAGTDNTVTVFSSQCTDAPVCIKFFAFNPCLGDKEELPDLECTAPSDHTAEKHDSTASISMPLDEPRETHDPLPPINTNPQHSPPLPPHSTGNWGYQHRFSVIGKWSQGGGLGITQSRFSKMVPGEGRVCCLNQGRNKDRM